jgi:hypothetical protein
VVRLQSGQNAEEIFKVQSVTAGLCWSKTRFFGISCIPVEHYADSGLILPQHHQLRLKEICRRPKLSNLSFFPCSNIKGTPKTSEWFYQVVEHRTR